MLWIRGLRVDLLETTLWTRITECSAEEVLLSPEPVHVIGGILVLRITLSIKFWRKLLPQVGSEVVGNDLRAQKFECLQH